MHGDYRNTTAAAAYVCTGGNVEYVGGGRKIICLLAMGDLGDLF
jgi:hypothetical protein